MFSRILNRTTEMLLIAVLCLVVLAADVNAGVRGLFHRKGSVSRQVSRGRGTSGPNHGSALPPPIKNQTPNGVGSSNPNAGKNSSNGIVPNPK